MNRICFVIQRYGGDIVGGSESYCRQIATRLADFYDVEILTSKAKDPATWRDEYDADVEVIDGLTVRRFSVEHEQMVTPGVMEHCFSKSAGLEEGFQWIEKLGPYCPALIEHLKSNVDEYDAIIIMTYLYYPAVMAALEFGSKAIMIPTAHDEVQIYQPIYKKAFENTKRFYFLTPEERSFFEWKFNVPTASMSDGFGGVGVDVPEGVDEEGFRISYGLGDAPYILYAGRIEEAKGCKNLIRSFMEFKGRHPSDLKLALIGKLGIDLPDRPDIKYLGFLSEEEKFSAMKGARAFVNPSQFESLSIVILEAMKMGTPILVNGRCEVLKGHCKRSNGGFYYTNYLEFEALLDRLLCDEDRYSVMVKNARAYVEENYTWEAIINGLRENIDQVIRS